jgi:hypothetical protein
VNNVLEEVKNICSVLGCIETKQVSDAVKELNLILQRPSQVNIFRCYSIIKSALNSQLKRVESF